METKKHSFLERDGELATVTRQLDDACEGNGSLLVVEGPAGIGKTTLIRQAIRLAREKGMTVLTARGGILEQDLEYGVVRQMVEEQVIRSSPEERERLLAGPAAPAAAVLGLADLPNDPGPGRDPTADILHGLYWLIANLAESGPILAVFDDAHWGDAASLIASGYLSKRVEGLPVALIAGVRDDEPLSKAAGLSPLFVEAEARIVRPGAFTNEAVATVLRESFGTAEVPGDLVEACREASGGNPFFLTELADELASSHDDPGQLSPEQVYDAGPPAVRRSLLMRLGALGSDARALAWALATMGGEGDFRHAALIAGLEQDAAATAADTLAAAGIIDAGRPLRMTHPLVRSAVSEDIPASERARAHRRAFEILSAEGATDDATTVHALNAEATGDPALVEQLRRTAQRALLTGSPQTAAVHLGRAISEPPSESERALVVVELGRAEVRAGRFGEGLDHLNQSLDALTDPGMRMDAHRDRAFAAFASGGMDRARDLVHGALADMDDRESEGALQLEADLVMLAWLSGSDHELDLKRHLDATGESRAERTLLALLSQERHATGAHPDEVIDLASRALGGGRMIAEDTSEALGWYMATYALLTCEAFDLARETIDQAIADGHRRGSSFARAGALGCRSVLAINEGRLLDAEADARASAEGGIPPIMVPVNASFQVRALSEQGRLDDAEQVMREAGIEHGPGGPTVLRWIPWGRAILHEARGDIDAVRVDVAPLEEDDRAGRSMKALSWRALLARTLSRSGHSSEAEGLAAEHLEWAKWWGRPGALGIARRAAALAGPDDARVEGLEEAVETLASSSLAAEHARALKDLGVSQLRSGRKADGKATLGLAVEAAVACGARGTANAANAELEVAGAAPRRLGFDELTASERRVAGFAAEGRTNREIAEELFVTPKTVENHLTRVYSKLGVGSRSALSEVL